MESVEMGDMSERRRLLGGRGKGTYLRHGGEREGVLVLEGQMVQCLSRLVSGVQIDTVFLKT